MAAAADARGFVDGLREIGAGVEGPPSDITAGGADAKCRADEHLALLFST